MTPILEVYWSDLSLATSRVAQELWVLRASQVSLTDKVKMVIELDDLSSSMTYRARWLIELGDLSSSVFQEKKKREKMEVKAIMTHMEYKI